MPSPAMTIDDAPFTAFHRRLVIYGCGGPFCDGYILGIIAIALSPLSDEIGLSSSWQGLIAAAALIGMFVGGALFGFLTDLIGRRTMYTLDLLVFVFASAAQFWVHDAWSLLVLRFTLGVAIGADYPIASALIAELSPRRHRGGVLAGMIGAWWAGYTVSFLVGYALSSDYGPAWRWMLASSAIPAAVILLLRQGTPESPRWLASKGRIAEAEEVVRRHLGKDYQIEPTAPIQTDYRRIFDAHYGLRTAFVCLFWSCQIIPTFGIYTFAPQLLRALGSSNPTLGTAVVSLFFLAGVIPAAVLVERFGRRPLLIIPFAITAATLIALAVVPPTSRWLITLNFVVFAVFNSGSSVLQWIYPAELFPTEVRATALGFATAVSRIGAAVGTFLVPVALTALGVNYLMLIFAGVCLVGLVVSWRYAPETRGLALDEASRAPAPEPRSQGSAKR